MEVGGVDGGLIRGRRWLDELFGGFESSVIRRGIVMG